VDDVFFAACSIDIATSLGLRKGILLTPDLAATLRGEDRRMSLRQKAYGYVTYKPRTERQVREHYRALDYAAEEIDGVIAWLYEFRLLDDKLFAERFVAASKELRPMSRRAMAQKLGQKGVPADVIDAVLAADVDDDADLTAARAVAQKKLRMMKADLSEKERADRLVRFLQYRGYSWSVIKDVLSSLPS
jgi:regulatory protein